MGFIADLATLIKGGLTFKEIKELYDLQEVVETSPKLKEAEPETTPDVEIEDKVETPTADPIEELRKLLKD